MVIGILKVMLMLSLPVFCEDFIKCGLLRGNYSLREHNA